MGNSEKAKEYNKKKILFSVLDLLLLLALLFISIFTNFSVIIKENALRFTTNPYLVIFLVFLTFFLLHSSLTFVSEFYAGYVLEHRYGLSNESLFSWLFKRFKSSLIAVLLVSPVILLIYFILINVPNYWWLLASVFLFLFSVVLSNLAPLIVFPLFFKFKNIDRESLKTKLLQTAKNNGLNITGIFSFNMSKETKKANAAMTGLGNTRRIILSDTLLSIFSDEEILSVFHHELGHYKFKHILKLIVWGFINTLASFYLADFFVDLSIVGFSGKFSSIADPAAMPLILLFITLFSLLTQPVNNFVSRKFEVDADRFALEKDGTSKYFISVMEKLADLNLSEKDPNRLVEILFYSHPAVSKRIKFAQSVNSN